jgi:hypothetical protein
VLVRTPYAPVAPRGTWRSPLCRVTDRTTHPVRRAGRPVQTAPRARGGRSPADRAEGRGRAGGPIPLLPRAGAGQVVSAQHRGRGAPRAQHKGRGRAGGPIRPPPCTGAGQGRRTAPRGKGRRAARAGQGRGRGQGKDEGGEQSVAHPEVQQLRSQLPISPPPGVRSPFLSRRRAIYPPRPNLKKFHPPTGLTHA